MNLSQDAKKAIIILGIAGLLFWFTTPGKDRKPETEEGDFAQKKIDAKTVLVAYQNAVKAGESATALEELNRIMEKQYGLRVYKKREGQYAVIDTSGNEIKV